MFYSDVHPKLHIPKELAELIIAASIEMSKQAAKAYRVIRRRAKRGGALRPGKETPLWNELQAQLRPHLKQYGNQATRGRVLGPPRQRINAFVTGGSQMPVQSAPSGSLLG